MMHRRAGSGVLGLALLSGGLACAGPSWPPAASVGPTASTLVLPGVAAAAETSLGEPGPGRVLVYRATTGHVPFREETLEGVVYRGRTPAEQERAAAAQLEEELRLAREREGEGKGPAEPELPPSERVAAGDPLRRLLDSDPMAPPRRAPQAERETRFAGSGSGRPVTIPAGSFGNPTALRVIEEGADTDGDGRSEELRFYDQRSGELVRRVRDEDGDSRPDVWDSFQGGVLQESDRDPDGDGRPNIWDYYEGGRMSSRRVDREGNGSVESLYQYRGATLAEERHDGNGDGAVDLVVSYRDGQRVRSEEDRNLDGRPDTWTFWRSGPDGEVLDRIERDLHGRGRPDVVERYEILFGRPVLTRLEEDRDGDGKPDHVERYEQGERVESEERPAPSEALSPI